MIQYLVMIAKLWANLSDDQQDSLKGQVEKIWKFMKKYLEKNGIDPEQIAMLEEIAFQDPELIGGFEPIVLEPVEPEPVEPEPVEPEPEPVEPPAPAAAYYKVTEYTGDPVVYFSEVFDWSLYAVGDRVILNANDEKTFYMIVPEVGMIPPTWAYFGYLDERRWFIKAQPPVEEPEPVEPEPEPDPEPEPEPEPEPSGFKYREVVDDEYLQANLGLLQKGDKVYDLQYRGNDLGFYVIAHDDDDPPPRMTGLNKSRFTVVD